MFEIERRGTFQLAPDGSPYRCGEPWTADYSWRILARVERLTPEGWTIDNHAVPAIVDHVVSSKPTSCEHFCDSVCSQLVEAIGRERCAYALVEIEGIPGSWIRAVYAR